METVWHITPSGVPAAAADEGFVHASFTGQLAETLAIHYPTQEHVTLLRLDPAALGKALVLEPSRNDAFFPHVYRDLTEGDILERVLLRRGPDGAFDLGPVQDS